MKIYVAGGSAEIDLVAGYIEKLRAAGFEITHDWTRVIKENGGVANPRNSSEEERVAWAATDLEGVQRADVVWTLLPVRTSFGCAFESGVAFALGKNQVVSGDWRATIFSSMVAKRFDTHDGALVWLVEYQRAADELMSRFR